jgi:hypothetical protein
MLREKGQVAATGWATISCTGSRYRCQQGCRDAEQTVGFNASHRQPLALHAGSGSHRRHRAHAPSPHRRQSQNERRSRHPLQVQAQCRSSHGARKRTMVSNSSESFRSRPVKTARNRHSSRYSSGVDPRCPNTMPAPTPEISPYLPRTAERIQGACRS